MSKHSGKFLTEVPTDDILGLEVISVLGNSGLVISVDIDQRYKDDDMEKNPIVRVEWDNGNFSFNSLHFFSKIIVK